MSLKTTALKAQLVAELGTAASKYWELLSHFINGHLTKSEFDELVLIHLSTPQLVQLHNSLLLSMLDSATQRTPPTPPPDAPKPARNRKRQLPYQGPDDPDDGMLRSKRLKGYIMGMGRVEREKMKVLPRLPPAAPLTDGKGELIAASGEGGKPLKGRDEILAERAVRLIFEGRDPPGTHLPVHLAQVTRAPTLQHVSERLVLITSQHNLNIPNKQVASLMLLALEAKLKSLVTHALTLTSTSRTITSINPSRRSSGAKILDLKAFNTMFTLAPHSLPEGSAARFKLGVMGCKSPEEEVIGVTKKIGLGVGDDDERHPDDPRWQLKAILKERSGIREVLDS